MPPFQLYGGVAFSLLYLFIFIRFNADGRHTETYYTITPALQIRDISDKRQTPPPNMLYMERGRVKRTL